MMVRSSSRSTQLRKALARVTLPFYLITTVMTGVSLVSPNTALAADTLFSDGFGTGGTDNSFDEPPTWTEGNDGATKQQSGGGNDSASPNGDRFARIFGDGSKLVERIFSKKIQ